MNERNVEPLSSENETFLMKVLNYLVVELNGTIGSEADILSAIETSRFKCIPRGILAVMILNGYAKTEGDKIRLIVKEEKGGEKMENHSGVTPGEQKVAEAILDHFKPAFEMGRIPSKMVFMNCLELALPFINKKVDADLAFKKMINNHYLEEENDKIILGKNGKDYLSL